MNGLIKDIARVAIFHRAPGVHYQHFVAKGTVELVSPEGDRINLKSKLSQYLSMANIFSNGYIKELELVAYEKEDLDRLIKFMYQGE